jgi:PHP family Zn ribbon phosphoesterase
MDGRMARQRNSGKRVAALFSQVEKEVTTKHQNYVMDLRVHTPNSLGYRDIEGLDTAPALVRLARVKGIDVLGITDFYSGDFIDRVRIAAQDTDLTVIPGFDIRLSIGSCEDAEMCCLFPEKFSSANVRELLNDMGVPEENFGDSLFRVDIKLRNVISKVEAAEGVVLPSRMDRTPSRRAAIPSLVEDYGFRTFDLAHSDSVGFFAERWPHLTFNLFSFSNANALAQVGSRIANVSLTQPDFAGIRKVLMRDVGVINV